MDVLQRRDVELDDGTASTRLPDFMVFLAVLVAMPMFVGDSMQDPMRVFVVMGMKHRKSPAVPVISIVLQIEIPYSELFICSEPVFFRVAGLHERPIDNISVPIP